MSVGIKGGASTNVLNVDSSGNTFVNLPLDIDNAGYIHRLNSSQGSNGQIIRSGYRTQDYRLSVGNDILMWDDTFAHGAVDTSRYMSRIVASFIGMSGNKLVLNTTSSVVSNASMRFQTHRTFTLASSRPVYVDIAANTDMDMRSAHGFELGLGFPSTSITAPTDGVFFRCTGGTMYAVLNYNSIEKVEALSFNISSGTVHQYRIITNEDNTEFWIDGSLKTIMEPVATTGGTNMSTCLPLMIKNYNIGTPPVGMQLQISRVSVSLGDIKTNRSKVSAVILRGMNSVSETAARTPAQTSGYDNSSTASTISLSNTVAGYVNLGGQFQFLLPTSGETDYVVFGYFSSPSSASTVSKNLFITDIRIDAYNSGAANTGSPALLQWGVAVGSTAESLTTTDSATSGTRGPRRLALGTQMIASSAAVGASSDRSLDVNFRTPLMVEPSTYMQLIVKVPVSTPSVGQFIKGFVHINGFFE